MRIMSTIWRLTLDEKVYLLMYPEQAGTIRKLAEKAFSESERRFARSLFNGPGDAFRHCFWSAMLCREIGYAYALRFTLAHEAFADNPSAEKAMDLHNNEVGLKIGRSGVSDQILISRSLAALRSGQLKILKP